VLEAQVKAGEHGADEKADGQTVGEPLGRL